MVNGGYIRVMQDVRGKHGSEGDYVMTRPLRGPLNPTAVDHSTDTYDTIDWLVKNIPESNGKVGILGISYDGFTSLMALVHPHPALRAAIPINAMVDGWKGDDWFHNGAFRLDSLTYVHDQEATRGSDVSWWSDHYDDYDTWLSAGSASDMAKKHGLDQTGFADKLMQHPAYDEFWQDQALDKILSDQGVTVPTMLVHSPVGPGRHIRQYRRIQSLEGKACRQGAAVLGHGTLVSPPGATGRQPRRGHRIRQRHRGLLSPAHSASPSSTTS